MVFNYDKIADDHQNDDAGVNSGPSSDKTDQILEIEEPFRPRRRLLWPWKLATICFAAMTAFLLFRELSRLDAARFSYETGFATDLSTSTSLPK